MRFRGSDAARTLTQHARPQGLGQTSWTKSTDEPEGLSHLLLVYGAAMMGGALACIGPLLRVFRVEPTEVLRDDG